jgi:XTP/dITP diphosphohydrolase
LTGSPPRERVVLATANRDKAAEIVEILGEVLGDRWELVPRPPDVPDVEETGETLEDNAILKAEALAAATGLPAIADDTGLEVDALGGRPGVHTARYSGEGATYASNVAKLLADLAGVTERRASFRTVAALVRPGVSGAMLAQGVVVGEIAGEARGAGGFGYDPVFVPAGAGGRTFAEMDAEEKNALSHRGRAFRALAALVAGGLLDG